MSDSILKKKLMVMGPLFLAGSGGCLIGNEHGIFGICLIAASVYHQFKMGGVLE